MGGDNGDVTAHYFHAAKLAAERSLLIGDKSLRTDSHRNRLVGDPRCEKNCIFTNVKASATDLSLKYIDGRGTKEFGYKQIYRAVVNVLGLPDLLYYTILHDYDHVGNAHGLLLVMGDKDSCDLCSPLDLADLFPGLEAESGIQVGERFVEKQYAGHFYKCTGNGYALLLTAGELGRTSVHKLCDLYQTGCILSSLIHLGSGKLVFSLQILKREEDVLLHCEVGIKCIILKYHTNSAMLWGK